MRLIIGVALIALVIAIGWGVYAQSQPAPERPDHLVAPVSAEWHASLPRDPQAATEAYLARVPDEMRARGEAVSNTRYWVFAARLVVTIGSIVLFLFSGAAASLAGAVAKITQRPWLQTVIFTAAFFGLLFVIALPVEVYAGYVRARGFGFADRSFWGWLQDAVLGWAVLNAFFVVGIAAFATLLRRRPNSWVGWAACIYFGLAMLYVIALPSVIEPLFNTYTALPDSQTKSDIVAMAHANGVPADNVYTADASRQTRLLNAHVSGFAGTARISVDDNTLTGQYPPSVRAVMGHEIGHYVMGHVFNTVLFVSVVAALGFAFIGWAGPRLIARYGTQWKIGALQETAGIAVFWLLFTVWQFVSDPLTNAYSRANEEQADLYGLNASQAPDGLAEFMIQDADTARLSPDDLEVALFYSHPSTRARVETAMRWRAEHMERQP